jgi:hypothetical protein
MDLPQFNRREAAFIVGVPIAWAVLLLFHPSGDGTAIYADLKDNVTAMLAVHVGMMIFVPLLAVAMFRLLRGIDSTAAQVARIALIPYVVLYVAWEAMQGIANAVLTAKVNELPATEQAAGSNLIQEFAESALVRDFGVLSVPAGLALVIASIALGLALRNVGAPRSAPALFGVAGVLITAHPPPFGPTGLVLFAATAVYVMRGHHLVRVPATQPTPT